MYIQPQISTQLISWLQYFSFKIHQKLNIRLWPHFSAQIPAAMGPAGISYPTLISTSNKSLNNYLEAVKLSPSNSLNGIRTTESVSSQTTISTYRSSEYCRDKYTFSGLKVYLKSRDSMYVDNIYFGNSTILSSKQKQNADLVKIKGKHKHKIHLSKRKKNSASGRIDQGILDIGSNEMEVLKYIVQ